MRILVTTASRHGATSKIGDVVAEVLSEAGHQVTRTALAESEEFAALDVSEHDAVVLGASVYTGSWLPVATATAADLVDRGVPVYSFAVGVLDITDDVTDPMWCVPRSSDNVDSRVTFGGTIAKDGLSLRERSLLSVVRAKDGEYTNWDSVREWARAVAANAAALTPQVD